MAGGSDGVRNCKKEPKREDFDDEKVDLDDDIDEFGDVRDDDMDGDDGIDVDDDVVCDGFDCSELYSQSD
jgi:hypothetical protein